MTTATSTITRARRQARVTLSLDQLTHELRGIATGRTPPAEARAAALRYTRAAGIPVRAIDEAALAFLASAGAAVVPIEDIDSWLCQQASAIGAGEALGRALR
jgi:hypothetical protein